VEDHSPGQLTILPINRQFFLLAILRVSLLLHHLLNPFSTQHPLQLALQLWCINLTLPFP
jgi:hypothetical protein